MGDQLASKTHHGYDICRLPSTSNDGDVTMSNDKDPLEELGGPMTRSRARKAKEALQQVL